MCEILKPLPQELENDIFKMSHEMQFCEVVDEMNFQFCGMDFSTACKRGCKSNTDIRCCCEPNCLNKNSMKQFNVCPQKISTLIYIIFNDYTTNKDLIEEEGWRNDVFLKEYLYDCFCGLELSDYDMTKLDDIIRFHEDYDSDDDSNIIYLDSDTDTDTII